MSDKESFFIQLKEKTQQIGIEAKDEFYKLLNESTCFLPAIIGNDLVLATFVPMIPSLIFDEVKQRLLYKDISDLGEKLSEVKDHIDYDFMKTTKGKRLFQDIIKEILDQTDQEKIDSFKALLINSMVRTNVKTEEKEIRFNILKNLTIRHIKFLKLLRDPEKYVTNNKIKVSGYVSANITTLFTEIFPEYDVARTNLILNDLFNMGLTNLSKEQLTIGMSTYGVHMIQNRLMPLGREIVDFIIY